MLAQLGRWCRRLHRRRRTAVDHRLPAHLHGAAIGRWYRPEQPALVHPGVIEQREHVEHRAVGHVVGVQLHGPVLARVGGEERRQLCHQRVPVSLPLAQAGVARVIGQVGPADCGAEPAPEPLVEGGDSDVAVLGPEGAHGHHRSMH